MRTKSSADILKLKNTSELNDCQSFDESAHEWAKRIKWISRNRVLTALDKVGCDVAEFDDYAGIADYYNATDFVEYLGF
jgi:hypothetical protein